MDIEVQIDTDDVPSFVGIEDAVDYYGVDEVLAKIDEADAIKYYGIEVAE